jgi:transcriptional regulator with XRE-family HTH domain
MARDGIGYRVARWRDTAGMTQQQLADRVGKTRAYISLIENGRKPVTKRSPLIDLANALRVSITDLTAQPYEPDPAEPGYAALFSAVPRVRVALTGPDEPASCPRGTIHPTQNGGHPPWPTVADEPATRPFHVRPQWRIQRPLPSATVERLDVLAGNDKGGRSGVIRRAIDEFLERHSGAPAACPPPVSMARSGSSCCRRYLGILPEQNQ